MERATGYAPVVDLVCLKCGERPEHFFLIEDEGKIIHGALLPARRHAVRICGGDVVPRGQERLDLFAPSSVVRCFGRVATNRTHLVRLRKSPAEGGASWTGTSLCGEPPEVAWVPANPTDVARAEPCPKCEGERSRGGGP